MCIYNIVHRIYTEIESRENSNNGYLTRADVLAILSIIRDSEFTKDNLTYPEKHPKGASQK